MPEVPNIRFGSCSTWRLMGSSLSATCRCGLSRFWVLPCLRYPFMVAMFYVIKKITLGIDAPGFTTLVVSIFFLAGIQLMTIGVIGEYIGRISDEVKHRPLYVARACTRR